MGILDPSCVASGPGNTVYAFALARAYGSTALYREAQYYVIAKSNANPTSFKEMTWSTVATISSNAFSMLDKVITCVVSDQGVVTIFGDTKYDSRISDAYGYMVIRYDPSATPNGGTISTGPGGWMNITVSNTYTLARDPYGGTTLSSLTSLAFYVKDTAAGGAQKLIHLTMRGSNRPTLQFGIVDEITKTLSHAANWTMNDAYPNVESLAYSNNELYLYMSSGFTLSKVSVYPLTGVTSTVPSNPRTLNTATTNDICSWSSHILSGVWDNSYHMLCTSSATSSRDTTLYTISNITQSGSLAGSGINIPRGLNDIDFFIPVAATADFAFTLDTGTGYLPPATYGIQVSGVGAGTVQGSKNIIVPETFGRDPNAPSPTYRTSLPYPTYTYPGQNRNADSGSDSTGVIVGVVMAILFLVFITIYCICRSSMKSDAEKKQAAANQYVIRPTGVPIMAQVPGMNGPYQMNAAGQPHPVGVYPQMPGQPMYPIPQPAPIAITDARITAPATATAAMTTTPPLQSVQNQMQHLQFSSHPRPNFVTSVGDNDEGNSQKQEVNSGPNSVTSASPNVSLSASFSPGWEPQPWTPPMRPANSNVNTSTLTE
ncbi:MAG: hypothetical protein J3Q66DRAFT_388897 [Benniella sp.]|nr:MAG: hypothetical protein J3Q66DRAFT_388897 [Benniella sp.]